MHPPLLSLALVPPNFSSNLCMHPPLLNLAPVPPNLSAIHPCSVSLLSLQTCPQTYVYNSTPAQSLSYPSKLLLKLMYANCSGIVTTNLFSFTINIHGQKQLQYNMKGMPVSETVHIESITVIQNSFTTPVMRNCKVKLGEKVNAT